MAQDRSKKDDDFDLAGEIRRMAAATVGAGVGPGGAGNPPIGNDAANQKPPSLDAAPKPPPLPAATGLPPRSDAATAPPQRPTSPPDPAIAPANGQAAGQAASPTARSSGAKAGGAKRGDARRPPRENAFFFPEPDVREPADRDAPPADTSYSDEGSERGIDPPAADGEIDDAGIRGRADRNAGDRRQSRRRAAAPSRDRIAANDDAPSIGGLIYALNQKPSRRPFAVAGLSSAIWAAVTLAFAAYYWGNEIISGAGLSAFLGRPEFLTLVATVIGPIGLIFALAMITYRAEEMRLRSSAMTEVAVRLAEPDRMAEQSVASLGQAVRRQVSFMNDAVARALGRAGELEALVHNEVSALERSYAENERKIRGLIQELSGERDALVNTSDRVSGSLRTMGAEIPELIEKLSGQQLKLAKIIEGAGQNLTSLETAIATQTGNFENALGQRTDHLQAVLTEYTEALSGSLDQRMEQIGSTIASRTGDLQIVFEEYTRALDTTLGSRAEAIDSQFASRVQNFDNRMATIDGQFASRLQHFDNRMETLDSQFSSRVQHLDNRMVTLDSQMLERTQALDNAFSERLRLFDESIQRSAVVIDQTVGDRTYALTAALDEHAKSLGDTLSRQSLELDESLLQGIGAVRRTSENITRQSIKAIEGLASQSELLKNVSENLLSQINGITNRFENQGQQILRSANALETANYKIDKTLQTRHAELSDTLDRMSGKADELSSVAHGYSRQIEGSMGEAERRARSLTAELAQSAEERSRSTIAEIERLKSAATDNTTRALEDLRSRFSNVSQEVSQSLGTLTGQFTETSGEVKRRAAEAASELAVEQQRLRAQIQSLPDTTREGTEAMRKVLQDHLRALDQLSNLSQREAGARDISRPTAPLDQSAPRPLVPIATSTATREEQTRALSTLSSALSQQMQTRGRPQSLMPQQPLTPGAGPGQQQPGQQQPGQQQSGQQQSGQQQPDGREGWSLGDLLKRASLDDDGGQPQAGQLQVPVAPMAPTPIQQQPAAARPGTGLDIAAAARALDPATAAAIWQRLGAGQRGIMVRSIYQPEGRALFDDTIRRIQAEPGFGETVGQYISDFERVLQEAERQDPSGQVAQQHLGSDYGRVYLFLAHASGRIN